jgi:hypothetical protein
MTKIINYLIGLILIMITMVYTLNNDILIQNKITTHTYKDCFTLPPKIYQENILRNYPTHDCPTDYNKFNQYLNEHYEYVSTDSNKNYNNNIPIVVGNDLKIYDDKVKFTLQKIIKSYAICCKKN